MDIIDVSPDDLVLPGDCLGGAVLDLGIQVGTPGLRNYHVVVRQTRQTVDIARRDGMQYDEPRRHLVINCCHEATRDRLRRVLAAGERCAPCDGTGGDGGGMAFIGDEQHPPIPCEACNGTGYTRQPYNLSHFIDAEIAGRITERVAAGLMWASVLRVEAGRSPLVALKDVWRHGSSAGLYPSEMRRVRRVVCGSAVRTDAIGKRHQLAAAEQERDSEDVAGGVALLNVDEILFPLPDRIARLRLED